MKDEMNPLFGQRWFSHLHDCAVAVHARWQAGVSVASALNAEVPHSVPVQFVPQTDLPDGMAYEQFIAEQRAVPTRDNWHDFFNGLIWLHLPQTKARLNALQAAEIRRHGVQAVRGPVRDAATLFDENALLLHAPDDLWQALVERRWNDLFGCLRPLWQQAQALVFGHAALEKLMKPYKSITTHVWRVTPAFDPGSLSDYGSIYYAGRRSGPFSPAFSLYGSTMRLKIEQNWPRSPTRLATIAIVRQAPGGDLTALDAWLAGHLTRDRLAAKPFAALPVLGIPGWWPANENPDFYADARVFRQSS